MPGLEPGIPRLPVAKSVVDGRVHRIKSGGGLPGHFDPGTGHDGFVAA
jgi:hypothetical protein